MATQAETPSQLGKMAVVTEATGGLVYETAMAVAKSRSRSHPDRPRRSKGTVGNREDPSRSDRRQNMLRASRSGQPCIDRRLRAADGSPAVSRSPDQQCGSDGVAPPANHGGWFRDAIRNKSSGPLRPHGPVDVAPRGVSSARSLHRTWKFPCQLSSSSL